MVEVDISIPSTLGLTPKQISTLFFWAPSFCPRRNWAIAWITVSMRAPALVNYVTASAEESGCFVADEIRRAWDVVWHARMQVGRTRGKPLGDQRANSGWKESFTLAAPSAPLKGPSSPRSNAATERCG
jgi:hypothetical protein